MKSIKVILALLFISIFIQAASAEFYADITVPDGSRPYQFNFTLSNASGTSTTTLFYLNGHASVNFTDIYFTSQNRATTYPHYIEENSTGKTWLNITETGAHTVRMWYGNASQPATSNGTKTFLAFCCEDNQVNTTIFNTSGTPTVSSNILTINAIGENVSTKQRFYNGTALEFNLTASATNGDLTGGFGGAPFAIMWNPSTDSNRYTVARNGASTVNMIEAYNTQNTKYKVFWESTTLASYYIDNTRKGIITTNIPTPPLNASVTANTATSYQIQKLFVRNLTIPEPTFSAVGTEQEVTYIPIVASDTIQYSNDTLVQTNSVAFIVLKTITVTENYTGSWKITYDMASSDFVAVQAQLVKNGVAYGNLNSITCCGYTTFSQTFTNISILAGDVIQIYGNSGGAGTFSSIINYRIKFDYDYANATPTLLTPANNSIISFAFPPQVDDVVFTWSQIGDSGYQFQVAEDNAFNLLEYDITTTSATTTKAMDAGTHYWRVRTANSGVYGNWSDTFDFLMSESTPSLTGAAIQGVVYFLSAGTPIPLSGATVYLYNSTFTTQAQTGSNGYFLFTGLENLSIYNMKASLKDYQTSEIAIINVSGVMTYNIQLKPAEPLWFPADKDYVLFRARWLFCFFDCAVPGATITVYNYGEATPAVIGGETNPKITDSSGSASFLLFKTQRYRLTIVNASAGISQEMTIYPKDTEYLWMITNNNDAFQDHDILEKDAIHINVTKVLNNATNASIVVTYTDDLNQTTALSFFLNQTNVSLASYTTTGNGTYTFNVTNYQGQSYLVHILSTHTEYGLIDNTYSVFFEKTSVGIDGIPQALWLWVAVGLSFFVAAMFTASTVEIGLVVLCGMNWIFLALGAYGSIDTTKFGIALTLVSVIAVFAYAKKQQTKEGYT